MIQNLAGTGLPVASLIRTAKIATIKARDAERLGRIDADLCDQVTGRLAERLHG